MLHFLYRIRDKRTGEIGYVGITSNPNKRMADHLAGYDGNGNKNEWLAQSDPEMEIVEVLTDRAIADRRETETIAEYQALGYPLTNIAKVKPAKQRATRTPTPLIDEESPVALYHPLIEAGDELAEFEQGFLNWIRESVEADIRRKRRSLNVACLLKCYYVGSQFPSPDSTAQWYADLDRWHERTEKNLSAYGYEVRAAQLVRE